MSGTSDYSKVAAVILMASIGSLFNIVGAQGVIYSLARNDLSSSRRADIFSATLLVTLFGMLLFSACLVLIGRYTGIRTIFAPNEIFTAAAMSWLLCLLVSLDSVFAGALKARRLITTSGVVEFAKLLGLLTALFFVSRSASWKKDCGCFIVAVMCSGFAKAALARMKANVDTSNWAGAWREIRQVTRINSWQWLLLTSAFFFQQADRLIIASRLGGREFAIYNFCWQVSVSLQLGTAASLMYILPIATARVSDDSPYGLRKAYLHDVKHGVQVATILAVLFLTTVGAAFNTRILPDALREGFPLFLIMSACMYVSSLSVVPYYYLVAFAGLPAIAIVNLVGASLSFGTALATVGSLGVTGLALSKAWSAVTLSCYWFCRAKLKKRVLDRG
jgi:O-antigen/teichoic acid export membrane protein